MNRYSVRQFWLRSNRSQDYREDDQAMVEAKHHSEGEHFEECEEDVAGGEWAERKGQECGDTSVENCRTNTQQGRPGLL